MISDKLLLITETIGGYPVRNLKCSVDIVGRAIISGELKDCEHWESIQWLLYGEYATAIHPGENKSLDLDLKQWIS